MCAVTVLARNHCILGGGVALSRSSLRPLLNLFETCKCGSPHVAPPQAGEVWRWGESNPRPRNLSNYFLHV